MTDRAVLVLGGDEIMLRFPAGDFTDTVVRGLIASKRGSTAGTTIVSPWSDGRIAAWRIADERWRKYGQRAAGVIGRAGRSVRGDGLVQRIARRLSIPLAAPPRSSTLVQDIAIDSAVWRAVL